MNRKADAVADRVIRDLDEMAKTILYDFKDMSRQLRMLIILGKVREGSTGSAFGFLPWGP